MIIKYKTASWAIASIERVECVKETGNSIWERGRLGRNPIKYAKSSRYHQYFDTWEAAHAYLLDKATRELNAATEAFDKVSAMQKLQEAGQ